VRSPASVVLNLCGLESDVATPLEVQGLLAEPRAGVGRGAARERALENAWATWPWWLGRARGRLDCAGDAPDVGELARDVAVHPRACSQEVPPTRGSARAAVWRG
jgi:hypothetical protein